MSKTSTDAKEYTHRYSIFSSRNIVSKYAHAMIVFLLTFNIIKWI